MAKKVTMWQDSAGNLHTTEEKAKCADARIAARASVRQMFDKLEPYYDGQVNIDDVVDLIFQNLGFFRTVLDSAAEPDVKKNLKQQG